MQVWWIKHDKNNILEIIDEWMDLLKEGISDEEYLDNLINWTEKNHKIVSKKLDFGEPFEAVDIEDPPLDKFIKHPNGNPFIFPYTCKIKK